MDCEKPSTAFFGAIPSSRWSFWIHGPTDLQGKEENASDGVCEIFPCGKGQLAVGGDDRSGRIEWQGGQAKKGSKKTRSELYVRPFLPTKSQIG